MKIMKNYKPDKINKQPALNCCIIRYNLPFKIMASINRHAIEISSNTRTSSGHRSCGSHLRLDAGGRTLRRLLQFFVVPARVTTLAVLRGPVQLRSVWPRSRPDRGAILPCPGHGCSSGHPIERVRSCSSALRSALLPCGRLSALRVRVLAADKGRHYGSPEGASSRGVQPPFTSR